MVGHCTVCGNEFERKLERAKYCSRACAQRAWREQHPELHRDRNKTRYAALTDAERAERLRRNREWRQSNPERVREIKRAEHARVRARVLEAYGGSCECCGETHSEFLSLDHRHGGGNEHKRRVGRGIQFLRWVIREGFPASLRILCHNCNQARGAYGYCPHERER